MRFANQKGPKWDQNEVFQVLRKIDCKNVSDFLHRVMVAYWLYIDVLDLSVEKSSFEIFWVEVAQNV